MSKKRKNIIIIGGGLAGCAAGSYLQRLGYATTIFEMGSVCGGVNVSWKRGGYVFDGATNWLPGSSPALGFHKLLCELIDFSKLDIIEFDEFALVEAHNGASLRVYKDAAKLEAEMLRIAPEDRRTIQSFCNAVRRVARLTIPMEKPFDIFTFSDWIGMLWRHAPLFAFALKWRHITIARYATQFSNPDLRNLFRMILPHHDNFSVLALITTLGWMCMKSTGYPLGGSAAFAALMEEKYRSLGGTIAFNMKVRRIIVNDGRACGIETADGARHDADAVISTADGYDTLFTMLDGKYLTPRLRRAYDSYPVFPAMLQISFGCARQFDGIPNKVIMEINPPLRLGGDSNVAAMLVRVCSFDPGFSPPGKTAVVVNLRTDDYAFWVNMRENDRKRYVEEKNRVREFVLDMLEKRFGAIRSAVEVCDVATPATYIRYTNIWKGSYQGWLPAPGVIGQSMRKTLPGLRGFYMAGQWVDPPGGITRVIISARHAVQILCHDDGVRFDA